MTSRGIPSWSMYVAPPRLKLYGFIFTWEILKNCIYCANLVRKACAEEGQSLFPGWWEFTTKRVWRSSKTRGSRIAMASSLPARKPDLLLRKLTTPHAGVNSKSLYWRDKNSPVLSKQLKPMAMRTANCKSPRSTATSARTIQMVSGGARWGDSTCLHDLKGR